MRKQEYILEKQTSFQVKHIFECGQCFRWHKNEDGSYTGVVKNTVIQVIQQGERIIFKGIGENDLKTLVDDYFDLDNNYYQIKKSLSKIDDFMRMSTEFGEGIRILHQDLWECMISFIISANNNIPRIKKIIEKMAKEYGQKIEWEGKVYYTFPTPQELCKASIEDLRACGLGFRDKRVFATTQKIVQNEIDLEKMKQIDDTRFTTKRAFNIRGDWSQSGRLHFTFCFEEMGCFSSGCLGA